MATPTVTERREHRDCRQERIFDEESVLDQYATRLVTYRPSAWGDHVHVRRFANFRNVKNRSVL